MRHQLLMHIVWTTRDRRPTIDRHQASFLCEYLPIIARQERARVLELGIVATHLHLLLRVHPATVIPRLLQRMKGGTSTLINRHMTSGPALRWAKGYSVTSVSPRQQEVVAGYVRCQNARHPGDAIPGWANGSFVSAASAEPSFHQRAGHPGVASATSAEPRL